MQRPVENWVWVCPMRDGEACLLRSGMRFGPHRQVRPRRDAAGLLRWLAGVHVESHQFDHCTNMFHISVPLEDAWLVQVT